MTSGSFRSVSRPRNRRKSQSARLRVLASQSEVALDRSETFLRNQDPSRTQDTTIASFPPNERRYFRHCDLAERLHVGRLANKSRFPKNRRDPVRCDRLHLAGGGAAL